MSNPEASNSALNYLIQHHPDAARRVGVAIGGLLLAVGVSAGSPADEYIADGLNVMANTTESGIETGIRNLNGTIHGEPDSNRIWIHTDPIEGRAIEADPAVLYKDDRSEEQGFLNDGFTQKEVDEFVVYGIGMIASIVTLMRKYGLPSKP